MMAQQNITRPQMQDVFGIQVPVDNYYLHHGHAWAVLEGDDRVRVGLDDFQQKRCDGYRDYQDRQVVMHGYRVYQHVSFHEVC